MLERWRYSQPLFFFGTGGELIIYCTATRKQKDNARQYLLRKQI
jgi:hypothetical protein